jgi:hypothetical protein
LDRFDCDRFVGDVLEYVERQRLTRQAVLVAADVDVTAGLAVLRGRRAPSLRIAVSLADVCDLTLDAYRVVP